MTESIKAESIQFLERKVVDSLQEPEKYRDYLRKYLDLSQRNVSTKLTQAAVGVFIAGVGLSAIVSGAAKKEVDWPRIGLFGSIAATGLATAYLSTKLAFAEYRRARIFYAAQGSDAEMGLSRFMGSKFIGKVAHFV